MDHSMKKNFIFFFFEMSSRPFFPVATPTTPQTQEEEEKYYLNPEHFEYVSKIPSELEVNQYLFLNLVFIFSSVLFALELLI
jgi:hypothetical protein